MIMKNGIGPAEATAESERLDALARVAHDAWCSEDDWDEMDGEARDGWVDVVRAVLAAADSGRK
jgi:hypothetical protein